MRAIRVVVLGFVVLAPPASFGAPDVIRDEFRVDQTGGPVSGLRAPSVAADAAGNFIVTWVTNGRMYARQFAPDGTSVTDQFEVDPESPGTEAEYPRVIMRRDGSRTYFIWSREGADEVHHVMLRRYRLSSRQFLDNPRQIDQGVADSNAVNPNLAIDPSTGRLGVVWSNIQMRFQRAYFQAYFRELPSSGDPDRPPVRLEHNEAGGGVVGDAPVYVAALGDGNYMAAWAELFRSPVAFAEAVAQRVNADGTVGASFTVAQDSVYATTSFPIARYLAAAGSPEGRALITWTASYPSQYHIFARLYDREGNSLGNEERVDQGGDCEALIQRVASDPTGVFTVVWGDNPTCEANTRTDVEVYARRFGEPLRSEFRVGDMGPVVTLIEVPDVAVSSSNLIVTWVNRPARTLQDGQVLAKVFANPPGPGF